ncbi:hypothetical protein [Brevundimonas vesicularis]|uniref:hypothetical protein n=1 Tax=Brevundimonas vesicularis TaxID=41276 RepID=UPI000836BEDB|nr:hypothetical protein [Brevundimonas vesicularis]
MVVGIDVFKAAFAGFEDQYTLIGGAAAEIHMTGAGLPFRATKDLDLVLCLEALKPAFVQTFWAFIDAGGYQTRERSDGTRDFFRFTHPADKSYPAMLELFSRVPDVITVPKGARLTPIPLDGTVESLSAMLLDDTYYELLQEGTTEMDGVPVVDVQVLIPFKAFAYNNLARDRAEGGQVDKHNVTKHRNDVFKLLQLLGPAVTVKLPGGIAADLGAFVEAVSADETFDPKALKLSPPDKGKLIARLKAVYNL